MPLKTIFLDRDGVINQEVNYLYKIDDFEFIDGIFDSCRYLQNLDYKIIIITNQSGISRGYYSERDYLILTKWMLSMFTKNNINILDIFHCPHGPDSTCECRKPKPGMFIAAKNKHNINMKESWMIGDRQRDITAASLAGITNTILVGSGHKTYEENSQIKYHLNSLNDIRNVIKF